MTIFRKLLVYAALCTICGDAVQATEGSKPSLLKYTAEPAVTSGLGELGAIQKSSADHEVRIWVGFGTVVPEHMIRILVSPEGDVSGSVFVYYPHDLSFLEEGETEVGFRREVHCSDESLRRGTIVDVCTSTLQGSLNWRKEYEGLVEFGLLELPDESELPPSGVEVTDGAGLLVEIKSAGEYRAYQYINPGFRDGPEAAAAVEIMERVGAIMSGVET